MNFTLKILLSLPFFAIWSSCEVISIQKDLDQIGFQHHPNMETNLIPQVNSNTDWHFLNNVFQQPLETQKSPSIEEMGNWNIPLESRPDGFLEVENSKYMQNSMGQESLTKDYFPKKYENTDFGSRPNGDKILEYVKHIISENRKKIIEHNSCIGNRYRLRQNRFIVYSHQEFQHIYLTLQVPTASGQPVQVNVPQQNQSITKQTRLLVEEPVVVDWKAARRMTSVKYQKDCGSCYAFTALAAIESAYIIKGQFLNLAQQQLVDCSARYMNFGCHGGWTINSYRYIRDNGVVSENFYPYKNAAGTCQVPQNRPKFFISGFVELPKDCSAIIQALKNQPLSIAVNADGWQYYSDGIFQDCQAGQANHGVLLAGVDAQSWLIKNSWGYAWGEQGYIRINRNAPNQACRVCQWGSYPII